MASQRILVLATSTGGGNWPPLAAVTVDLHQAGHTVQCFGDPTIAQDFASAGIAVKVVPAEDTMRTFFERWFGAGAAGSSPLQAWAEACLPTVRELVSHFRPRLILSELFTLPLARLTKEACGLRWCYVNPGYYFGADSRRPFEADYIGPPGIIDRGELTHAVGEADLVLHATDPLFDPPPPSLPQHHHYVGPLWWERSNEVPPYLDVPGAPWVLVTVSSAPQPGEMTLAGTALRTLAAFPLRVVLTLTAQTLLPPGQPRGARRRDQSPLLRRAYGPGALGSGSAWGGSPCGGPRGSGSDCTTSPHGAAPLNRDPSRFGKRTIPGKCGTDRRPHASARRHSAGTCTH